MNKNKLKYLPIILLIPLSVHCAIGDFVDIPDTSLCIRSCTEANKGCLNKKHTCVKGDVCFTELEACFDGANQCNHDCADCELKLTCANEDACRDSCGDIATECTNKIRICIDIKEECVQTEVKHKETCLNGPGGLMECAADCIAEVEEGLK